MKQEVVSAVDFLTDILRKRKIGTNKVDTFRSSLEDILCSHYENHWFPDKPYKGSAYRCMRIVDGKMDALMAQAGQKSGISKTQLLNTLPRELTMWVDPDEVSYRIGEDGSVGVIFDRQSGNQVEQGNVDIPSRNSSPASITSRTPSPVYWPEQMQQRQHQSKMQQQQQQQQQQFKLQQQQQYQYQARQTQDFFPRYLQQQHQQQQQQQQRQQQQQQQPHHQSPPSYQQAPRYEPESTCRDSSRSWLPGGSRTQSPANWEYLATYAAS